MTVLAGKTAVVTGGSRGIGAAICRACAGAGARVAVCYNTDANAADAVVSSLEGGGGYSVKMDVTQRSSVCQALDIIEKTSGIPDILVNNAGYLKQMPFADIDDAEWARTLDTNLKGVFLCAQVIGETMCAKGRGSIINMTSVGGQMGGGKAPHYAASKAGVISMTKSLARLYSPRGVRVNAIAPGFIRTEMYDHILSKSDESDILASIPVGRVGEPHDVADAALFLASDQGSYITGHVLNVNGGLYLGAGS